MSNSRVANTKRNIAWSFVDYAVTILFQFASRTIIVQILGKEYLGLSSLFTSILQVLNMTELGFSSAIIYNLYKPIANHDDEAVCALLAFYKKIYKVVGCIILFIGIGISPFLRQLIEGDVPANVNIYVLYFLYLANTAVSYFVFAYKSSLLNALQRMDLTKIAYSIVNVSQCFFQIIVLLLFRNYYLFVIGTIIGTMARNILAAYFAKKKYPQYVSRGTVPDHVRKDIWHRVKGLLITRISGVTYNTFGSIILSAMVGLVSVANYNNYWTIYGTVETIIILVRHSMQASVGNSVASESVEKNLGDIFVWQFLFSMIAIWCSCCLLCLYQPFMLLWMGNDSLLPNIDVILLSLLFMVSTVQHAFCLYLSANGLWWELRWPYIISTIANIIMNLVFCGLWGTTGIILATLIAQLVFGMIWQCAIIFKEYFKTSGFIYYKKQLLYFVIGVVVCVISYLICMQIRTDGIAGLIIKAIISATTPLIILLTLFRKTEEFERCKSIVLSILHK